MKFSTTLKSGMMAAGLVAGLIGAQSALAVTVKVEEDEPPVPPVAVVE